MKMFQQRRSSRRSSERTPAPSKERELLSYARTLTDRGVTIVLGGLTYRSARSTLRGCILVREALELMRSSPVQALQQVLVAGALPADVLQLSCVEVLQAAALVAVSQLPRGSVPAFSAQAGKEPPWHYPGRGYIEWVHALAWHYGWSEATILETHPEAIMGLLQEIAVEEQLEYERTRTLSRIAYDAKGKYVKPDRPVWMLVRRGEPPVYRIPKRFAPQGNIQVLGARNGAAQKN